MKNNVLVNFSNFKRTWNVESQLPVNFTIHYSNDIFNPKNLDLIAYGTSKRRLVVIDKTVNELYGESLKKYFEAICFDLKLKVIDATEENKDWKHTEEILKFFEDEGALRRETIVVIGGGVLLDLVGFCCSIYRRGIPYVKVPTTLLAIVDASVGVKVAANHFGRRNRIGAYYPPVATLIDKTFISTQSEREIVNGLAEIFKLALIKSEELFELLENNYDQLLREKFQLGAIPVRVINMAITGMIDELQPNLWEKDLERPVDFGHTFSPIIEMSNIQTLKHGEAVVLDCLLSSCISFNRGFLTEDELKRIFNTAKNLKLPTWHRDFGNKELVLTALEDTMRHRNGNQYIPIPIGIGRCVIINNLKEDELISAMNTFEDI